SRSPHRYRESLSTWHKGGCGCFPFTAGETPSSKGQGRRMHYRAVLLPLPLFLSLAASVAPGDDPTSVTPTAPTDDFVAGLQAAPVPFENVKVFLDVNDEINLEVSYDLLDVGHVSITVHGEDEGSGHGMVTVGDTVVAEVG